MSALQQGGSALNLGSPPDEKLKPSLPFTNVCLDLFRPINVRQPISKTDIGKAYGVKFTCMFTRAIHLDVAAEYSTKTFLQAFRRFTLVRGTPEVIFSHSNTQLVGANAII